MMFGGFRLDAGMSGGDSVFSRLMRARTGLFKIRHLRQPCWRLIDDLARALELSAGGEDVAPPRLPDVRGDSVEFELVLKLDDLVGRGHFIADARAGVPDDEIDLERAVDPAQQRAHFVRVLKLVVDAAEQDVLKGQLFLRAQRNLADCPDEAVDVPLAVDGHDLFTDLIVGRVERNRQLGPQRFGGKALNPRQDSGSGDGHARLGNSDFRNQQTYGAHEGVIVEEGFAHAHKDQVDAVAAYLHVVALEHRDHLPGDFSGGKVADNAQLGGEAELAIDGAADLAGDAEGGVEIAVGLAAVAELAE